MAIDTQTLNQFERAYSDIVRGFDDSTLIDTFDDIRAYEPSNEALLDVRIIVETVIARDIIRRQTFIPAVENEAHDILDAAGHCHVWHTADCGI